MEQEKELISFSLPFHSLKPDIKTKDVSIAYRSCMKAHRCLPCNSDYFVQPHTVENRGTHFHFLHNTFYLDFILSFLITTHKSTWNKSVMNVCGWKARERTQTFPFSLFHSGAVIMPFWFQNKDERFSLWLSLCSWWHIARVWPAICQASRPVHKSWGERTLAEGKAPYRII